jgi:hypothetical protein
MEANRATCRKLDEPDLSHLLKELLGELVPAEAEAHQNGHVDVTISHPRGLGFKHITECKIWRGAAWHRQGMTQVLGYATGREERVMVLAFFIHHRGMVKLLAKLREQIEQGGEPGCVRPGQDHPQISGAYLTWHAHPSGSEMGIVHFGCHLWQEESDHCRGSGAAEAGAPEES